MSLPFTLADVRKVSFFKRDEITTDLICCEVEVTGGDDTHVWFNHEDADSWNEWIIALSSLPGFASDWFTRVSSPAFAPSATVAYVRPVV